MAIKIVKHPDGSATLTFSGKLAKEIREASQREKISPEEWVQLALLEMLKENIPPIHFFKKAEAGFRNNDNRRIQKD